jgi:hypothetical protein
MEDVSSLFVALALMILFAVTSMRFGVDSRDGFRPRQSDLVPRDGAWHVQSAASQPHQAARDVTDRPASAPADCGLAPCPA